MDTLAYIMVEGYHKSAKADAENGNYNPSLSGLTRNHVDEAIMKLNNSKQLIKK